MTLSPQLAAPKGTLPHRAIGWIWALLMLLVSVSALFIHELCIWGRLSPFHLLAIFTLVTLPLAVWGAHRHQVTRIVAPYSVFSSVRAFLQACLRLWLTA
jgi:uncharacterized membrane protein